MKTKIKNIFIALVAVTGVSSLALMPSAQALTYSYVSYESSAGKMRQFVRPGTTAYFKNQKNTTSNRVCNYVKTCINGRVGSTMKSGNSVVYR